MLDHSDGTVEGPHEMGRDLSCVVHEHLSVLLSHSDQEPKRCEKRSAYRTEAIVKRGGVGGSKDGTDW